eukprot:Rhum_TRINITY_DN16495_c0_g1::Rhum_TRINITY_DN16495_c0_g1_i1::g.163353::m.163353
MEPVVRNAFATLEAVCVLEKQIESASKLSPNRARLLADLKSLCATTRQFAELRCLGDVATAAGACGVEQSALASEQAADDYEALLRPVAAFLPASEAAVGLLCARKVLQRQTPSGSEVCPEAPAAPSADVASPGRKQTLLADYYEILHGVGGIAARVARAGALVRAQVLLGWMRLCGESVFEGTGTCVTDGMRLALSEDVKLYNKAAGWARVLEPPVRDAATTFTAISATLILQSAAAMRSYVHSLLSGTLATPKGSTKAPGTSLDTPLLFGGVCVSDQQHRSEAEFAARLLEAMDISGAGMLPANLPLADCSASSSESCASAMAGAVIPEEQGLCAFYCHAFSAFSTQPTLLSLYIAELTAISSGAPSDGICTSLRESPLLTKLYPDGIKCGLDASARFFKPMPWVVGLWEAEQSQQLATVLSALEAEKYSIPLGIHSPLDTYEEAMQGVTGMEMDADDLPPEGLLLSTFAREAHTFLLEARADAAAAFHRRRDDASAMNDTDVDAKGQWAAARVVLRVTHTLVQSLLASLLNHLHIAVDRFGSSEHNMLPFLHMLSDAFTLVAVNFDGTLLSMLTPPPAEEAPPDPLAGMGDDATPSNEAGPPEPRRLNIPELSRACAALSQCPHSPHDASTIIGKVVVLLGVGVDKFRADAEKMIRRALTHYTTPGPNNRRYFFSSVEGVEAFVSQEDDAGAVNGGVAQDGSKWVEEHSPFLSFIISELIFPVCALGVRLAPEIATPAAAYCVSTTVSEMTERVARTVLGTGELAVGQGASASETAHAFPPSDELCAAASPPAAAYMKDMLHLHKYVTLHVPELGLGSLHAWTLPKLLLQSVQASSTARGAAP